LKNLTPSLKTDEQKKQHALASRTHRARRKLNKHLTEQTAAHTDLMQNFDDIQSVTSKNDQSLESAQKYAMSFSLKKLKKKLF